MDERGIDFLRSLIAGHIDSALRGQPTSHSGRGARLFDLHRRVIEQAEESLADVDATRRQDRPQQGQEDSFFAETTPTTFSVRLSSTTSVTCTPRRCNRIAPIASPKNQTGQLPQVEFVFS